MHLIVALLALTLFTCSTDPAGGDPGDTGQPPGKMPTTDPTKDPAPAPAFPPGMLMAFAGPMAPDGWWLCDGRAVSREQYAALHNAIGSSWGDGGDGDGPLFNIPDLRGRFVRGADNGAGHDPEAKMRTAIGQGGNVGERVGSMQDGSTALPKKKMTVDVLTGVPEPPRAYVYGTNQFYPDFTSDKAVVAGGDVETRPANVAVNWIIKY